MDASCSQSSSSSRRLSLFTTSSPSFLPTSIEPQRSQSLFTSDAFCVRSVRVVASCSNTRFNQSFKEILSRVHEGCGSRKVAPHCDAKMCNLAFVFFDSMATSGVLGATERKNFSKYRRRPSVILATKFWLFYDLMRCQKVRFSQAGCTATFTRVPSFNDSQAVSKALKYLPFQWSISHRGTSTFRPASHTASRLIMDLLKTED